MASFQEWLEVSAAMRSSFHGRPGERMFRFLDQLSCGHQSLYPRQSWRGFLVGLAPWARFTEEAPTPSQPHLQITEHGETLFRIALMDFHNGEMAGQCLDVCSEVGVHDVFDDYLLRLRYGDPRATLRRSGMGWKMHSKGKSRGETISEWLARPGEWGLDQVSDRPRHQSLWLADCASVRWLLTQMGCSQSRQFFRFFKPRPNCHDPVWIKRLAEGLPDAPCGRGSALCVCHEVLRYLRSCVGNSNRPANPIWSTLVSGRLSRLGGHKAAEQRKKLEQHRQEVWRELLGNPFDPVALEPKWLAFQDGVVCQLAQAIDQDNDFSRMPILGDALEEAGCVNEVILQHCRSGTHLLGCWLVDALLGRR